MNLLEISFFKKYHNSKIKVLKLSLFLKKSTNYANSEDLQLWHNTLVIKYKFRIKVILFMVSTYQNCWILMSYDVLLWWNFH